MRSGVGTVHAQYILAPRLDIDSVDQCPILYSTRNDLRLAYTVAKSQSVINMNNDMPDVVQCASVDILSEPTSKTSVVQSTQQHSVRTSKQDHSVIHTQSHWLPVMVSLTPSVVIGSPVISTWTSPVDLPRGPVWSTSS